MEGQNHFISRVNQLDALHLDKEVVKILREGIINPLNEISPTFLVKYQPEINLLLDTSIWCLSMAKCCSTFGQQVLLISYNKKKATTSRLTLHFLFTVLPKYLKEITEQKFTKYELLQKTIDICQHIYILLSVINFFRFLKTGKYPTLIDFLLRWDLISHNAATNYPRVGYDFMTRELIWAGFMEFLGTVLPFINYRKLRQFFKATLFRLNNRNSSLSAIKNEMKIKNATNKIEFNTRTTCSVCDERPTHPHKIDCGHIFCYYCIYENIELDPNYCCPLCDMKIENVIRIEFNK